MDAKLIIETTILMGQSKYFEIRMVLLFNLDVQTYQFFFLTK